MNGRRGVRSASRRRHPGTILPPCIAVLPNGMVSSFYRDAANGELPVESVIIKDLIPHVDQTYRTLAEHSGRVIEGYSMGGYGSAHLGFKYPGLFGTVIVDAGALDRKRFAQYVDNAEHPDQWVKQNLTGRHRTQIRFGVGFAITCCRPIRSSTNCSIN